MADTDEDPFAPLEALTAHPGPQLTRLMDDKFVSLGARLFLRDPARFEAIFMRIHHLGPTRTQWRDKCKAIAKASVETKLREKEAEDLEERLDAARAEGRAVLAKGRPVAIAEAFRDQKHPHILHWSQTWLDWRDNRYVELEDGEVMSEMQAFMANAVDSMSGEDFVIGPREVDHAVAALRNVAFQVSGAESRIELPMWLCPLGGEPPARYTVALKNGLLGVLDGQFMKPSFDFFTRNSLPFNYDPEATCPLFLAFLESVWPEAEGLGDNKRSLQEAMGYILAPLTHHQKMFWFFGHGGSGKGVLTDLMVELVGIRNTESMAFDQLFSSGESRFAKESLFDKTLLLFPDVVLHKDHVYRARQFLLNTVGNDEQSSDRKNKSRIRGKLLTRVWLAANKVLTLPDQSGEIRRRLVPFRFSKSFDGTPDANPNLRAELREELPGIFNWCLEGLRRLEERGHFLLSPENQEVLDNITLISAPLLSFYNEVLEKAPGADVTVTKLFKVFQGWNIAKLGEETWLKGDVSRFRETMETVAQIAAKRRGGKITEPMVFPGLRIKQEFAEHHWPETVDEYGDDEPVIPEV